MSQLDIVDVYRIQFMHFQRIFPPRVSSGKAEGIKPEVADSLLKPEAQAEFRCRQITPGRVVDLQGRQDTRHGQLRFKPQFECVQRVGDFSADLYLIRRVGGDGELLRASQEISVGETQAESRTDKIVRLGDHLNFTANGLFEMR